MNELVIPANQQLAKMTKSVNAKLARFEKMLGQAQKEAVEIGKELTGFRAFIQENSIEGGFDGWLRNSFRWSRSQAYRLIDVGERYSECPNLGHYDTSALYLLAAPGTPETATEEAKTLVEQGGFVDYTTASEIVDKHKSVSAEPPYADDKEDEAKDDGQKRSRSRNRRATQPKWEYRCRNGSLYVSVAGTDDPAVAKEALAEALARISTQTHEQLVVAVMPPEGVAFGLLDAEEKLEVDDEGNIVRSTEGTTP